MWNRARTNIKRDMVVGNSRKWIRLRAWVPGSRLANHPDTLDLTMHRSILLSPQDIVPASKSVTEVPQLEVHLLIQKILIARQRTIAARPPGQPTVVYDIGNSMTVSRCQNLGIWGFKAGFHFFSTPSSGTSTVGKYNLIVSHGGRVPSRSRQGHLSGDDPRSRESFRAGGGGDRLKKFLCVVVRLPPGRRTAIKGSRHRGPWYFSTIDNRISENGIRWTRTTRRQPRRRRRGKILFNS